MVRAKGAEWRTLVFHRLHQSHVGLQSAEVWLQNVNRCCRRSDWNKVDFFCCSEFPQKFTV